VVIGVLGWVGIDLVDAPTVAWWLQRPLWLLAPLVALVPFVAAFAPLELRARRR
jgi:hypothetical protein